MFSNGGQAIMYPLIIGVVIIIAIIYLLFRTSPTEVLGLNKICKNCGAKEGYFKCKICRSRK